MSDCEEELNDIYDELIELKDIIDKIKNICETIIEYDLEKEPSELDNNISELKKENEDLGVIHVRDYEKKEIRNDYISQIHTLEHELSTYNKTISGLWNKFVLYPRILKRDLIAKKNGKQCVTGKQQNLIIKNTSAKIKASQLLKFYYEKKQRLKEIYEKYENQEHIEELLRDIDEEDINIIYDHHQKEFIDEIEEKDKKIEKMGKAIEEMGKVIEEMRKKAIEEIEEMRKVFIKDIEENEKSFIKEIEEKNDKIYVKDEEIIKLERKLQYFKKKSKSLEMNNY